MKKFLFFFILIFSVFFSYKIAFASNFATFTSYNGFITTDSIERDYLLFALNPDWTIYEWVCFETSPNLGGDISSEPSSFWLDCITDSPEDAGYGSIQHWNFTLVGEGDMIYNTNSTAGTRNFETYFLTPITPPTIETQGTYEESPLMGEVVATSGTGDVLVAFGYYLDTEQDPNHDTAQWCMRLLRNDGSGSAEFCDDVAFDTYTEVSHTFTGLALDSQWDWSIIFTRPGFFIDEYSILHSGSNYFWSGRFTIDSSVEEIYTAYTTCSITDLAGCFQNAIVFLFYPSQSSLNDFSNLYDAIKDKPPFGYISAVQTALQGINDTGTSVFTLETMPILDTYIFTPVRTALIWIMWLAFIFMFYHRLKNIHL